MSIHYTVFQELHFFSLSRLDYEDMTVNYSRKDLDWMSTNLVLVIKW